MNEIPKSIVILITSLSETNRNYWQEYEIHPYANLCLIYIIYAKIEIIKNIQYSIKFDIKLGANFPGWK